MTLSKGIVGSNDMSFTEQAELYVKTMAQPFRLNKYHTVMAESSADQGT